MDINKLHKSDIILFHKKFRSLKDLGCLILRKILGSWWHHCGHYDGFGSVIESLGRGVVITPISKYLNPKKYDLGVVRVNKATKEDCQAVDNFIHILVGSKYDVSQLVVNILSLGLLSLLKLTHLENRLRKLKNIGDSKNEFTCSETIAEGWASKKFYFIEADTANVSPKDIADSEIVKWIYHKRV